jgi:hypothetical protein
MKSEVEWFEKTNTGTDSKRSSKRTNQNLIKKYTVQKKW